MKKPKSLLPLSFALVVGTMALGGCNPNHDDMRFTLFDATTIGPAQWGPSHRLYTHDALVYSVTESGFVDFVPDDSKTSYKVIPVMALELPTDVTSTLTDEEVKRYDMDVDADKNGEKFTKGQKWLIKLNPNAVFEDGSKMDADTYLGSLKRILDPQMQLPRSKDFTTGKTAIAGGDLYLKSNRVLLEPYLDEKGHSNKKQVARDGWFFNLFKALPFFDGAPSFFSMCKDYLADDKDAVALMQDKGAFGTESEPKDVRVDRDNQALRNRIFAIARKIVEKLGLFDASVFKNDIWEHDVEKGEQPFYLEAFLYRHFKNPEYSFENVGIKKIDDYSFYYYFRQPLANFFAQQFFAGNWAIKLDLWDKLRKPIADSDLYSTTYASSKETYVGYGPYKLESFQTDKNFKFVRNESWVGYKNGLNEGKYQIDSIHYEVVNNPDTVLTMFRKGEIDSYGLLGSEKKIFDSCSRVAHSPTGEVTKLTLNSVYDLLKALQDKESDESNHTILSNLNFRKALSLGFDRKTFCQVKSAAWIPFNVPISTISLSDPENKTTYRATKEGKAVVERHFGLDKGEPNYIAFDLAEARKLVDKAVEEENASNREGSYKKGQKVRFIWECPTEGWKDRINWIVENFKKLMVGTLLEDKFEIEVKLTSPNDFVKHINSGVCDMAISTWSGGNTDPFQFIGVYTDSKRAFEPYPLYRDYLEIDLDTGEYSSKRGELLGTRKNAAGMQIDSEESGQEKGYWFYELNSGKYSAMRSDNKTRLNILSALESHIVGKFNFISFAMRQSSSINSYRLQDGVDHYIPLIGYGGIREMRLLKNNGAWKKWVSANTDSAGYIDYNK